MFNILRGWFVHAFGPRRLLFPALLHRRVNRKLHPTHRSSVKRTKGSGVGGCISESCASSILQAEEGVQ